MSDQFPLVSALAVPSDVVPPRNNSTVELASAVPVKVGVLIFVTLSVVELPESLAAAKSGVEGAVGALVSIVTLKALDAALVFPAVSVALAVML
jgi:hypothetical protein